MANYRQAQVPYNNYRHAQMNTTTACRGLNDDMSLAMAYVPWQTWRNIYDVEKGFQCGTIFQELNMPFTGKRGARS